jgi:G3E family GTPase
LRKNIRRVAEETNVSRIVIETSGVADLEVMLDTFSETSELQDIVELGSVITVVDVSQFDSDEYRSSRAAAKQIQHAGILVLNKVDLLGEAEVAGIEAQLRESLGARRCPFLQTTHGRLPLELVIDIPTDVTAAALARPAPIQSAKRRKLSAAPVHATDALSADFYSLTESGVEASAGVIFNEQQPTLRMGAGADSDSTAPHGISDRAAWDTRSFAPNDGFSAVAFCSDRPFDALLFEECIEELGGLILRGKGLLWLGGFDRQVVFQLVGRRTNPFEMLGASAPAPSGSQLVLIGRGLDSRMIQSRLSQCLLQSGSSPSGACVKG